MRFQATTRVKSRMACGNQAGAEAAWREFAERMERLDRKDLTRPGDSDRPSPLHKQPPQSRGIDQLSMHLDEKQFLKLARQGVQPDNYGFGDETP